MTRPRGSSAANRVWITERHYDGTLIEIPAVRFSGPSRGPAVAVIAGMHAGESAGVIAALRLVRRLEREEVHGDILVIPVLNLPAFYARSMQLSPVDLHELHYVWPGNPEGSFSEHLIDMLFRELRSNDAVVDLHGGELVQDLTPYVGVPWDGDGDLWRRSLRMARCFEVPFVDRRAVAETPLALPRALLAEGIPNIWTEIGRNGIPSKSAVNRQYRGLIGLLRLLGNLQGRAEVYRSRIVGPRHWSITASQSGIWDPAIRAGQHVALGQVLGTLFDSQGVALETIRAPVDSLVEFVTTHPAINFSRQPHGYQWHQHLVQLVEDPSFKTAGSLSSADRSGDVT